MGASSKMLTQQLRQMEADGILRRVIPGRVTVVEYSLTPAGETLRSIIATLHAWGEKRLSRQTLTIEVSDTGVSPRSLH